MRRVLIGQRFDERSIDESKDGDACAHAQRYHQGGRKGKARVLTKLSEREAQILHYAFEKRNGRAIAVGFFGCINTAQLHNRDSLCFLRRHTGAEVIVDVHLQMTLDLRGQLSFTGGFLKQASESS